MFDPVILLVIYLKVIRVIGSESVTIKDTHTHIYEITFIHIYIYKNTQIYINTHAYVHIIICLSMCYQKMGAVHIFKNRGMVKLNPTHAPSGTVYKISNVNKQEKDV